MVPLMGPSVPRTVETIMCLTLKPAVEWAVSTVHVFGPAGAWAGVWAKTGITRAAAAARVRIALRIFRLLLSNRTSVSSWTPAAAPAFQLPEYRGPAGGPGGHSPAAAG